MSKLTALRMLQAATQPRAELIQFGGGWDGVTPPLSLPSGFAREAQNYECDINGGYGRVLGYERYDGRTAPSSATYSILDITLTGSIAVGDTITGVDSTATAYVIAVGADYLAITKIAVSTFQSGEVLNVGGNPQATTTSTASLYGASTTLLDAQYKNLAADAYRADIAPPTGSGNNLGGVRYNGVLYTWRNNAGGTAANLWKSTASGWSQVTLFNEISFTLGGVTEPAEGTTLTQGAVTSVIKRVVLVSGTWAAGSAAGRLIIANPAGGNFAGGAATVGAINLTLTAIQTAITLLPGGDYKCIVETFTGDATKKRVYGCDGVNRGFEFDGTVLVPITTGMTTDTPTHVRSHKNHLFFSFSSSAQHSSPGFPYVWSPITGASELAMGDTITGFATQPGSESVGAMAIFTRNRTSILYGTGVSNWQLVAYRSELGAYSDTIQDVGFTFFLDDQGLTNLQAAQAFGNFSHSAFSSRIRTWLNTKRTKVTTSCVCRDKGQYRIFFSDGYGLFVTFGASKRGGIELRGMMPVLFTDVPLWAYSSEESDGTETIYFGAADGNVYQMEKGTSFDGDAISHYLKLAWDFVKSPRVLKDFIDASLEISGGGYAAFSFSYDLGYSSSEVAQPTAASVITSFAAAQWDVFTWDEFVWDGQTLMPAVCDMPGQAENVSIVIRGSSDYHAAIKFSGALVNFIPRRRMR